MWGQLLLLVPCTLGACSYWLWVEVGVGGVGTSGDHSVHGWWWLWGIVPKYQAHFYPVNLDTRTFAFETGRTGAVVESPDMFLSPDWSSQTWPWSHVAHWHNRAKNCTFCHSDCAVVYLVVHWKIGPTISLSASLIVMWYICWPTGKVGTKNCTFPHSPCTTVHLVAHWESGAKNCTFPPSPCTVVHLVANWQNRATNFTFFQSGCTVVHLVVCWQNRAQIALLCTVVHLVVHWQIGPKIALSACLNVLWYI